MICSRIENPMKPDLSSQLVLGERPEGRNADTPHNGCSPGAMASRSDPRRRNLLERNEGALCRAAFRGDVARRIDFVRAGQPGLIDLDALSDLDTYLLVHDTSWLGKGASGRVPMWKRPYEMYSARSWRSRSVRFRLCLLNGITTAAPIASLYYRQWPRPSRNSKLRPTRRAISGSGSF